MRRPEEVVGQTNYCGSSVQKVVVRRDGTIAELIESEHRGWTKTPVQKPPPLGIRSYSLHIEICGLLYAAAFSLHVPPFQAVKALNVISYLPYVLT